MPVISAQAAESAQVRLKDIGRFDGWRENYITGIGLVIGLSGTGDSARSKATRQSLSNLMARFGINVSEASIHSRNVAAVVVTGALPPFARTGDRLDVTVNSIGDAKSLSGGSLLLTPLRGPNDQLYCLAQGAVNVSGYRFEQNDTYQQSNHPTAGLVSAGCSIEKTVVSTVLMNDNKVRYLLNDPDYAMASSVARMINQSLGKAHAIAKDAGSIEISFGNQLEEAHLAEFLSTIEALKIDADRRARVVINERSGLVVAGSDVRISPVSITQGDLRVAVTTTSVVSQPLTIGRSTSGVQTAITRDSNVNVDPRGDKVVSFQSGNTVNDLVFELTRQKVGIRQIVAVLQALRASGALYADIIIQ